MINQKITKILIANRGEIAIRIMRTLQKMGIQSVAVYALDDADALHCRMADEAFSLGAGQLTDTYLNVSKIIEIATASGAQAIHPGYGFLSENPSLVKACEDNNIIFIGPDTRSIKLMGNKIAAREFAVKSGLPVTQGLTGSMEEILVKAHTLPFPVLVKAAAGGGGKGMRIVHKAEALSQVLETTSREAKNYFGDGTVYLEQYIENPRHIEVQVLGDQYGNAIHLFERECSIQRRYQKIIEESPSPTLTDEVRLKMGEAAVKICRDIGYRSAGTIEFLVDEKLHFYFLEMNTRIQVEHPVTELVTGFDLVEEQIYIAMGRKLSFRQNQVIQRGHAIECRIYAENPANNFMPSPGTITLYHEPLGLDIRIDSSINGPADVHSSYDPMISKLICYGENREQAIEKSLKALENYVIQGIQTNIPYLRALLAHEAFQQNHISTAFCEKEATQLMLWMTDERIGFSTTFKLTAFLLFDLHKQQLAGIEDTDVWSQIGYWRTNSLIEVLIEEQKYQPSVMQLSAGKLLMQVENTFIEAEMKSWDGSCLRFSINGKPAKAYFSDDTDGNTIMSINGLQFKCRRADQLNDHIDYGHGSQDDAGGSLFAPMPGRVLKVNVKEGDLVNRGTVLLVVEAMKMENNILAPANAMVDKVNVKEGEMVDTKLQLVHLSEQKA